MLKSAFTVTLYVFSVPTDSQHPKDAYDVLQAVTAFIDGPQSAIAAFHAEAGQGNPGHPTARQALQQYFTHEPPPPTRAAAFLQGTSADQQRLRADLVSVAQFLMGE